MNKKEQTRLRVQRYRDKQKSVTPDKDVTQGCNAEKTIPASYVEGLNGKLKTLPERPRYLSLSDGQVLDRLNQPTPNRQGWGEMQACNGSANNFKPRGKR